MIKVCSQESIAAILFGNSNSSHPKVFSGKVVLKVWSKFTGENPCRRVISIKLQSNFIKITLRHGCLPVTLLQIFTTPFLKNTCGRLLLEQNRLPVLHARNMISLTCIRIENSSAAKNG